MRSQVEKGEEDSIKIYGVKTETLVSEMNKKYLKEKSKTGKGETRVDKPESILVVNKLNQWANFREFDLIKKAIESVAQGYNITKIQGKERVIGQIVKDSFDHNGINENLFPRGVAVMVNGERVSNYNELVASVVAIIAEKGFLEVADIATNTIAEMKVDSVTGLPVGKPKAFADVKTQDDVVFEPDSISQIEDWKTRTLEGRMDKELEKLERRYISQIESVRSIYALEGILSDMNSEFRGNADLLDILSLVKDGDKGAGAENIRNLLNKKIRSTIEKLKNAIDGKRMLLEEKERELDDQKRQSALREQDLRGRLAEIERERDLLELRATAVIQERKLKDLIDACLVATERRDKFNGVGGFFSGVFFPQDKTNAQNNLNKRYRELNLKIREIKAANYISEFDDDLLNRAESFF